MPPPPPLAVTQADGGCARTQVNEWICCTAARCPPCWCGAAEQHSGPTLLQSYKSNPVRPGLSTNATAGDGRAHLGGGGEGSRSRKRCRVGAHGGVLCSPPPCSSVQPAPVVSSTSHTVTTVHSPLRTSSPSPAVASNCLY